MTPDIIVQLAILVLTLSIFYAIHKFPKQSLTNIRTKNRFKAQAQRHFIQGAHLLSRARSTTNRATSLTLAKSAVNLADQALSLEPKDAATLILKGLALDVMGHKSAALKCVDQALTFPAVKSLSEKERGDALFTRAELRMAVNRRRRVDSAMADLVEAVRLSEDNGKAFCLLGQCFVIKGMRNEAKDAFERALRIEPGLVEACQGLLDLNSVS